MLCCICMRSCGASHSFPCSAAFACAAVEQVIHSYALLHLHVQLRSTKLSFPFVVHASKLCPAVPSQLGPRCMQPWEEARLLSWPGVSVEGWELAALLSRTAMPRSLPEVTSRQLAKILRANFPESGPSQALIAEPDVEKVVQLVEDLLQDIANATAECPAGLLTKACSEAFTVEKSFAISFGATVARAYSFCKQKARESTTGKKLTNSVRSVVAHMNLIQTGQVRGNLTKGADKIRSAQPEAKQSEDEDTQPPPVKQTPSPSLPLAHSSSRNSRGSSSLRQSQVETLEDSPAAEEPEYPKRSRAEIRALFGLGTPSPKKRATSPGPSPSAEVVCLVSPSPVATASSRRMNQKTATAARLPPRTSATAAPAAAPAAVDAFDSSLQKFVRTLGGEIIKEAELKPGPDGFCLAQFEGEKDFVTEVPNLLLQTLATPFVAKRPASKQGGNSKKKKKAEAEVEEEEEAEAEEAEAEETEEGEGEEDEEPAEEDNELPEVEFEDPKEAPEEPEEEEPEEEEPPKFACMFYKSSGKMALRAKTGDKGQLFQFGSQELSREDLQKIADRCIQQLEARTLNRLTGKAWCEQEVHTLLGALPSKPHTNTNPYMPICQVPSSSWTGLVRSSDCLLFVSSCCS